MPDVLYCSIEDESVDNRKFIFAQLLPYGIMPVSK